ncbi:TetR/AcrR family transcriptional regulator [Actinomadura fibrosa]|uniref:TetR/AcrR family transcriptional regulator n=1 Tax=Actinomadura fibrosa TaxID=111802 RepID=A0ABW2XHI4_9ACTN|nr:TetR/AcrR family transcriptional regulator [Actinomadura fibrosa]
MEAKGRGRPPKYCSRSCQAKAYRARQRDAGDEGAGQAAGAASFEELPDQQPVRRRHDDRYGQAPPDGDAAARPQDRRKRGPYRKGIERRRQILDAALEVYAELGERGTSLQEIADRVGVRQPALMYYFRSREELLLAVLERREEIAVEAIAAAARDPIDALVRAMRYDLDQPGLAKLYLALSAAAVDPGHHAHGFFVDRYRRLTAAVEREFAGLQAREDVRRDVDPAHLARLLLAVLDGLQLQWLMDPSVDVATLAEAFGSLYMPSGRDAGSA